MKISLEDSGRICGVIVAFVIVINYKDFIDEYSHDLCVCGDNHHDDYCEIIIQFYASYCRL